MNDNVIEIGKILVIFIFIPKDIEIRVNLSIRSFFFHRSCYACFRNSHAADNHSVQSRLADGKRLPETACISAINHAHRIK